MQISAPGRFDQIIEGLESNYDCISEAAIGHNKYIHIPRFKLNANKVGVVNNCGKNCVYTLTATVQNYSEVSIWVLTMLF